MDIQRRTFLVSVDDKLMKGLLRAAQTQHTSTEKLVNSWLAEKVGQTA